MATSTDLFRAALELDAEDRAELVALLLDSLEWPQDDGVEAAWLAEIERRVNDLDAGITKTIPWEQARAQILEG